MNPLLKPSHLPFGAIPFDQLKDEDFLPAVKEAITIAKAAIEKIVNNREEATFENTLVALEKATMQMEEVAGIFFNLHGADTNDTRQQLAKEISPLCSEFSNDMMLNEDLFMRISSLTEKVDRLGSLSNEQKMLMDEYYKNFVRNGALLNSIQKERLRAIDKELSTLSLEFGDHLLNENKAYKLVLSSKEELVGLPEGTIEAAAQVAKEKGDEGKWVFTLDAPSYLSFMKSSKRSDLREKFFKAFTSKGCKGDSNDNKKTIQRIVELKHERAKLLGYKTHADFVLEKRMAETPTKVFSFLKEIRTFGESGALRDMGELKEFAKKIDGLENLNRWDTAYYSELLQKEKYGIDDELLKPYFKLENCIEGAFKVASELFDLNFTLNTKLPTYHADVQVYEVTEKSSNRHIGLLYTDFFPRAGKRQGAWMTSFKSQYRFTDDVRPHIAIVCNFTKPTQTKPSLLLFSEVTTLFHEFGHALHGLLSECRYPSLSGTNVYWDFVELPSQIMENWCYEKEALDLFAVHYQTKEKIPADLISKILKSSNFQEGLMTMRQLSLAVLDMAFYSDANSFTKSVEEVEEKAMAPYQFLPTVPGTMQSTGFSHIFAGGYSAGYYSYKWAEVLDADAFEAFKEKGVMNPEMGRLFKKHILSKGGSEHPMELYKKFRGQEPSVTPLLKRAGLI